MYCTGKQTQVYGDATINAQVEMWLVTCQHMTVRQTPVSLFTINGSNFAFRRGCFKNNYHAELFLGKLSNTSKVSRIRGHYCGEVASHHPLIMHAVELR